MLYARYTDYSTHGAGYAYRFTVRTMIYDMVCNNVYVRIYILFPYPQNNRAPAHTRSIAVHTNLSHGSSLILTDRS